LTLDTTRRPDMPGEHELVGLLRRQGIDASFVSSESDVRADESLDGSSSDQLALVDTTYLTSSEVKRCVTACSEAGIPVIALVPTIWTLRFLSQTSFLARLTLTSLL